MENNFSCTNHETKVTRILVEKKEEYATEARALMSDIGEVLGISSVEKIRIVNRYDIEGADEKLIDDCIWTVFSEAQIDMVYKELPKGYSHIFAVEYLPGQYDQRADAAEQCMALVSQNCEDFSSPVVR
ncbi:MAG: hypothetical protein FWE49_02875, partial [Synergistaceae bacterium]|nr:hypothetical protein [Synergistaceae bacterium]